MLRLKSVTLLHRCGKFNSITLADFRTLLVYVMSWAHSGKVDKSNHWIKIYPVDNGIGFPNTYPVNSDSSGG